MRSPTRPRTELAVQRFGPHRRNSGFVGAVGSPESLAAMRRAADQAVLVGPTAQPVGSLELSSNRHAAARVPTSLPGTVVKVRPETASSLSSTGVREDGCDPAGRPRIVVAGRLDGERAEQLIDTCRTLLDRAPQGLALDLTGLTDAGPDGIRAVAACLAAGRGLDTGVDIAVASSAGRRVLLATLAEV